MTGRAVLTGMGRTLFGVVVVVSLVILFSPSSAVPDSPPGTDKIVHFTLFAALVVTAVAARMSRRLALLLGLAYAALSEVVQAALPGLGRSGSGWDWLADAAGVIAGLLVTGVLVDKRGRPVRR